MPKESFLKNRWKSIGFAVRGLLLLLKTEASIKVQFVLALLMTAAGFYFDISSIEWCVQLLAIGLVMGIEGVNTAIEALSDYVQPKYDPRIGRIKDISAGAVMVVSVVAVVIGTIIYLPKIF